MKLNTAYAAWAAALLAVALFAAILLGFTGFRTVVSIAALFIVPIFLLLWKTSLDAEEKIFFSLFIGIGLFALAVWAVNRILPSFRLSIPVALGLFALAGFFLPRALGRPSKK